MHATFMNPMRVKLEQTLKNELECTKEKLKGQGGMNIYLEVYVYIWTNIKGNCVNNPKIIDDVLLNVGLYVLYHNLIAITLMKRSNCTGAETCKFMWLGISSGALLC